MSGIFQGLLASLKTALGNFRSVLFTLNDGGAFSDPRDMVIGQDGNYYLASKLTNGTAGTGACLYSLTEQFATRWSATITPSDATAGGVNVTIDLAPGSDGVYMLTSYNSSATGQAHGFLSKHSYTNGAPIWATRLIASASVGFIAQAMDLRADGNITVVGYDTSTNAGIFFVIRQSDGVVLSGTLTQAGAYYTSTKTLSTGNFLMVGNRPDQVGTRQCAFGIIKDSSNVNVHYLDGYRQGGGGETTYGCADYGGACYILASDTSFNILYKYVPGTLTVSPTWGRNINNVIGVQYNQRPLVDPSGNVHIACLMGSGAGVYVFKFDANGTLLAACTITATLGATVLTAYSAPGVITVASQRWIVRLDTDLTKIGAFGSVTIASGASGVSVTGTVVNSTGQTNITNPGTYTPAGTSSAGYTSSTAPSLTFTSSVTEIP